MSIACFFLHISTATAAIFARCISFLGLTASENSDLLMFGLHVCHASTDNWVFRYPLFLGCTIRKRCLLCHCLFIFGMLVASLLHSGVMPLVSELCPCDFFSIFFLTQLVRCFVGHSWHSQCICTNHCMLVWFLNQPLLTGSKILRLLLSRHSCVWSCHISSCLCHTDLLLPHLPR